MAQESGSLLGQSKGGSFAPTKSPADTGPQQPPPKDPASQSPATILATTLPPGTREAESVQQAPPVVPIGVAPLPIAPFVATAASDKLPIPSSGDQLGRNISVEVKPQVPDPTGTSAAVQPTLEQNVEEILETFRKFREGVTEDFKSHDKFKKIVLENFERHDQFKKAVLENFESHEKFKKGVLETLASLEDKLKSLL